MKKLALKIVFGLVLACVTLYISGLLILYITQPSYGQESEFGFQKALLVFMVVLAIAGFVLLFFKRFTKIAYILGGLVILVSILWFILQDMI